MTSDSASSVGVEKINAPPTYISYGGLKFRKTIVSALFASKFFEKKFHTKQSRRCLQTEEIFA